MPARPIALPRALTRLLGLPPIQAWMLVLLFFDLAALADVATGSSVWFGPVYLCVVLLATWMLGWRQGLVVGLACMAFNLATNGLSLHPHGGEAFAANMATRFAGVSLSVALIAAVRRGYLREWQLARTDALTGALNRQAFFEFADSGASRNWRLMLYADLDGLKRINDRDGHAAGDESLRAFAAAVRGCTRRQDLVARVGGDEFLLLLTVRDEAATRTVAARLHAQMNRVAGHDGRRLACSVGALAVPPGPASLDKLVRLADSLMYQAKTAGAALKVASVHEVDDALATVGARAAPRRTVQRCEDGDDTAIARGAAPAFRQGQGQGQGEEQGQGVAERRRSLFA